MENIIFTSWWMAAPFLFLVMVLLGVPSFFPHMWDRWFPVILGGAVLFFCVGMGAVCGVLPFYHKSAQALQESYLPFFFVFSMMYMMTSCSVISIGGKGTPAFYSGYLFFTALCASVIGTLGASMLFLRPLLENLQQRKHKSHTILFFIFMVCNVGGGLLPLGDPPLFMGFLKGVPFFWPLQKLSGPVFFLLLWLLVLYFLLDIFLYAQEKKEAPHKMVSPWSISFSGVTCVGYGYVFITLLISASMIVLESWPVGMRNIIWFCGFCGCGAWVIMRGKSRFFSWKPLWENVATFGSLFLFSVPIMEMLSSGEAVGFLEKIRGPWEACGAFWISGALSTILDNAPSYLLCLEGFGGVTRLLHTIHEPTLQAISAGSVFMGALTYIGNAPNLLVRSTSAERGIVLPSSMMYTFYALLLFFPGLMMVSVLFFL